MLNYKTGHVVPWWDDSFKRLPYIHYELTNVDDVQQWNQQGYGGFVYGGGLYNMKQHMPDYALPFFTLFNWDHVAISYYVLKTMMAVPPHVDNYPGFIARNKIIDRSKIRRAIIFLEDWKSGHYLEVDGEPFVKWKAGDWVMWNDATPHYAANIGQENRYTMQITGLDTTNDI